MQNAMRKQTITTFAVGFAILAFFAPRVLSQDWDEHLLPFRALTGKAWTGHFVGSSDSTLVHVVDWQSILGAKVVKSKKEVASLDFTMETYYFWDWEKEKVSFLQLTSRGIFSRGTVAFDEDKITLLGVGVRPNGVAEFKQTFAVRADGALEDLFYSKEDGRWRQGHLIEYTREEPQTK